MRNSFLPEMRELIASLVPITKEKENGKSSNQVVLTEVSAIDGTVVSEVTIRDLPDDVMVFKVDAFPAPDKLFNDIVGVRKRADFILLAQKEDKKRAIFIEMKRTKDSEWGIMAQLRGASCVLDYCNSILTHFFGEHTTVKGFEERYVSIGGNASKRPTHVDVAGDRNAPLNDVPERMQKLKSHSFTYQQLIRK